MSVRNKSYQRKGVSQEVILKVPSCNNSLIFDEITIPISLYVKVQEYIKDLRYKYVFTSIANSKTMVPPRYLHSTDTNVSSKLSYMGKEKTVCRITNIFTKFQKSNRGFVGLIVFIKKRLKVLDSFSFFFFNSASNILRFAERFP